MRSISILAVVALVAVSASAVTYRLDQAGRIELGDGIVLRATAYAKNWSGPSLGAETAYAGADARTGLVRWALKKGTESYGCGATTMLPLADGRVYVHVSVTLDRDYSTEGLVYAASLPDKHLIGGAFEDDRGKKGVFPGKFSTLFPYVGSPRRLSFDLAGAGRRMTLDFSGQNHVQIQDDRKWEKTFTLRIRFASGVLKAGSTHELAFCLSGEQAELKYAEPYAIRAGADWIPLDYRKEILPGSALDFSSFAFRDAPAGKHGWLKSKDGQFVFENLPDEDQRFWGANLCNLATCPSHEDADRIVTFFERAGYNTMRIHHYEKTLVAGSTDRTVPNPAAFERFDYLFARTKERGIYTTTDIFVSRPLFWKDVGIDREGPVDKSVAKGLFLVHEPAFENWQAFARNFLTHVNPYTGLRYADDPAMPFLSLVNEGCFAWKRRGVGVFDLDVTRAAWRKWLAERRAADPKFCPKAPADCFGHSSDEKGADANGIKAFVGEMEGRFIIRACDYLRKLGVKALLTDWNCDRYPNVKVMTNVLDYVDTHFYVNHPTFLGGRWKLPARVYNSNPDRAARDTSLGNGVNSGRLAYRANKPLTISEWNFTAPNSCRGAVGLLVGGCAALLDWDAMWRFDYIGSGSAMDDGTTGLSFFDVLADPFMTATERAGVLLYRRRELKPIAIGSADDYKFPIATEKGTGRFTVASDRTAGGFGLAGDTVKAGPLDCRLGLAKATVWVSALDEKPLVDSDRLLLTHLTDLKTDGISFTDEKCTVLQTWGSQNLIVRRGTAEVALALTDPAAYNVWALETNGARRDKLPVRVEGGRLVFKADILGSSGKARYLYEIVRHYRVSEQRRQGF